MLFDTHVHLNSHMYKDDLKKVIARALEAGVTKMAVIGFDAASNMRAIELAQQYACIYAVVGIHPSDARSATAASWPLLREQLQHPKVVALGECGFDYYHDTSFNDIQRAVFKQQLAIAKELDVPIVVHMRDSVQDTYDLLCQEGKGLTGVIHCYSGDVAMMHQFLERGFYIGLDGPVTFKNAHSVHEVAKAVPIERLVIETDGPYLTPSPYRGKRNEPAYVRYVAEKIAELKGMTYKEVCDITTQNGLNLYRIKES
ncbi:MAG: TatD family hydrolase [Defluviitaleaceae bacterium]|nr:TatD family hydrolase [Defluviitaleaceae bacterium]